MRRIHLRGRAGRLSTAATCVAVLLAVSALAADTDAPMSGSELDPDLRVALDRFAAAWSVGDHAALADLVAEKGAAISLARDAREASLTTPSRAHYLFKSIFRDAEGHALDVSSVAPTDDGAHIVLDWAYRKAGRERAERLFVTWRHAADGWRVVELRTGR